MKKAIQMHHVQTIITTRKTGGLHSGYKPQK